MAFLSALIFTGLFAVWVDARSTVRVTNNFGTGRESSYSFSYNVNDPLQYENTDQRVIKNEGTVEESYVLVNPELFPTSENIGSPLTIQSQPALGNHYENSNVREYPWLAQLSGPQFYPTARTISQTERGLLENEGEKLPPGYVPLVAKIDTPKGYKLLDESN